MVAVNMQLCSNSRMDKHRAIELLGGSVAAAAKAVGVSYSAVYKWPDILPQRIVDRVEAAAARIRGPELVAAGSER